MGLHSWALKAGTMVESYVYRRFIIFCPSHKKSVTSMAESKEGLWTGLHFPNFQDWVSYRQLMGWVFSLRPHTAGLHSWFFQSTIVSVFYWYLYFTIHEWETWRSCIVHTTRRQLWSTQGTLNCYVSKNEEVTRMVWPSQSPDLNCIENLWKLLKSYLRKQPSYPKDCNALFTALSNMFHSLPDSHFLKLIASMPKMRQDG